MRVCCISRVYDRYYASYRMRIDVLAPCTFIQRVAEYTNRYADYYSIDCLTRTLITSTSTLIMSTELIAVVDFFTPLDSIN